MHFVQSFWAPNLYFNHCADLTCTSPVTVTFICLLTAYLGCRRCSWPRMADRTVCDTRFNRHWLNALRMQRDVTTNSRVFPSLFHDLLLRSYLYHCVWSVITVHNLTSEKRDNNYSPTL